MKVVALPIFFLLAGTSHAQIKMSLSINGMAVGEATLSQSVDSAGRLLQTIESKISAGGQKAGFSSMTTSDPKGRPIRETFVQEAGAMKSTTVMTFGPKQVKVAKTQNGKTTNSVYTIPKGSMEDASTLWFIKTRPKKGAKSSHLHFDTENFKWSTENATYVGDETVPGTKSKGHHIHEDDGDMWLDDKGFPIRMVHDQGGVKMELTRK